MTIYNTSINLVDLATDSDADPGDLRFYDINGAVPSTWPVTLSNSTGDFIINEFGIVQYDDEGDVTGHPADGVTDSAVLTFTCRVTDGIDVSNTCTVQVDLIGESVSVNTAPVAADVTIEYDMSSYWDEGVTTIFTPSATFLTGASDADGDAMRVREVGGVVQTWGDGDSRDFSLPGDFTIRAWNDGHPNLIIGPSASVPASGRVTLGTLTFNIEDGRGGISATRTATFVAVGPGSGAGGGADPAANATVASGGALTTLLDAWEADWSGTATGLGIAATDPRYVDMDSAAYGALGLTNYDFPEKVTLRATDKQGGATFTSADFTGSTNLGIKYLLGTAASSGAGDALVQIGAGAANIDVMRCSLRGQASAGGAGGNWGVNVDGSGGARPNNILIEDNAFERFSSNAIRVRQADNITDRGNVMNEAGSDDRQYKDCTGPLVENNWSSVLHHAPAAAHMDFIQFTKDQTTNKGVSNGIVRGNICADWAFPNAGAKPFRQGMQLGDIGHTDILYEQNFLVAGNTNGMNMAGGSTGCTIRNNASFYMYDAGNTNGTRNTRIKTNGNTVAGDYNIERRDNASEVGINSVTVPYSQAGYLARYGHFRQGGDTWEPMGIGGDVSELYPVPGGGCHWDDPNPLGPAARLREIFIDGNHPGSVGWPVATLWNATHNIHGRITQSTVTVNDFPVDDFPYAYEGVHGSSRQYASIPLSGTGTPGGTVEARAEGATSWQTIATVDAQGDWSGRFTATLTNTNRRAEVRIGGATATTTNQFGTGHGVVGMGQSIWGHMITTSQDSAAHPTVLDEKTLYYVDNTGTGQWVTNSSPAAITGALKEWANTLYRMGQRGFVHIAGETNTSPLHLLRDANATRDWSDLITPLNYLRNVIGTRIPNLVVHWFSQTQTWVNNSNFQPRWWPVLAGLLSSGAAFLYGTTAWPGDGASLDHSFIDLKVSGDQLGGGAFFADETKILFCPPNPHIESGGLTSSEVKAGGGKAHKTEDFRIYHQTLNDCDQFPHIGSIMAPNFPDVNTIKKGPSDLIHPADDDPKGLHRLAERMVMGVLFACGLVPIALPRISGVTWSASTIDIEVPVPAGGRLSTVRKQAGLAALTGKSHYGEVMGIEVNNVPTPGVIHDDGYNGGAGGTGVIRVTRSSSPGDTLRYRFGSAVHLSTADINDNPQEAHAVVFWGTAAAANDGTDPHLYLPVRAAYTDTY